MELLIIGKGTVPIAAWELTTGVENIEEHGGTAEMSRATNGSQAGTQTSGCIVTVGVNGITGMKTVGGAKANSRQVIDSGDLPPKRIINLRILGAEHPRAEEWDTYYRSLDHNNLDLRARPQPQHLIGSRLEGALTTTACLDWTKGFYFSSKGLTT